MTEGWSSQSQRKHPSLEQPKKLLPCVFNHHSIKEFVVGRMDIVLNYRPFFIGSDALASIDRHDEFDEANGLELDSDLLMSLLEELQGEETDNDVKLTDIMESLEFEISHPDELNIDYSPVPSEFGGMHAETRSGGCKERIDTRDLVVSEDFGFSWIDMEMSSRSTSNELNNYWYMETYAVEMMDGMNEFGNVTDYSQVCYGAPSDQDQIYCSLWQENYDSMMN